MDVAVLAIGEAPSEPVGNAALHVRDRWAHVNGADWHVWVLPHETFGGELERLVSSLGGLSEDVAGVVVARREKSQTGTRIRSQIRAWRTAAALAPGEPPDLGPAVRGRLVRADVTCSLDRASWKDAVGYAERVEADGDWAGAVARWRCIAEGSSGLQRAYASVRAASLLAQTGDYDAPVDDLLHALAASPRLPEISLRMAAVALGNGRFDDGFAWAALADVVQAPMDIAHPDGTGSWVVPDRMSSWLNALGRPEAARFAAEAARRRASMRTDAELDAPPIEVTHG